MQGEDRRKPSRFVLHGGVSRKEVLTAHYAEEILVHPEGPVPPEHPHILRGPPMTTVFVLGQLLVRCGRGRDVVVAIARTCADFDKHAG